MTDKRLTIDDIFNAQDCETQRVDVPEWGGHVVIKSMTAEARDAYEISVLTRNSDGEVETNLDNARAKMVAACTLAPDGSRMFKSPDHVKMLGQKSGAAVNRIFEACQRLNAVTSEDIEELSGN